MTIASSQLLPLDGFRYQTRFGYFVAAVVKPPHETLNPSDLQVVKIELKPESCDACPVRHLSLLVSNEDLANDLPGVMRLIHEWAISPHCDKSFFDFECYYVKAMSPELPVDEPQHPTV